MNRRMLLLAACVMTLGAAAGAFAQEAEERHPVIARTGSAALVLWDATPNVAQLVKAKASDEEANSGLERGALRALARAVPNLDKPKTITVKVTYAKTGDVSPTYGSATFAGLEHYADLTMSGPDALNDRGKWKEAATSSVPLPAWITFRVRGMLPPR